MALVLLLLLLSPGLRGDSRWRVLLVPTRAFATSVLFWLALLPPGLAKAALPGNVTLWHYHLDHLGSTHSITDASGNLYRQTRTTAYGEIRGRYDGSGNVVAAEVALRHEFTGYQSEEKSGLQYAGARYYLPELGVFTSHDPARQFPSPYAYGPGDPINGTDPTGEDFGIGTILLVISIVAAVARFIHTGITTGKWGAAGIGLAINLAAIGIAYAVAQIAAPYANQFLNRLNDAWRTAYTYASRGYTAYRTAKAASSGDYITAAEIGLSLMAVVYNDYGGFQSAGARGGGVGYAAGGGGGQSGGGGLQPASKTFRVPIVEGAGSVRAELFIAAKEVRGYLGDNRDFDAAPNPSRSRAFFTLDFESGRGSAQVNPTCDTSGECASALPFGDGNTLETTPSGNQIRIRGALKNSMMFWGGPAIDFDITFTATSSGVTFSGQRDKFPSLEITRGSKFLHQSEGINPSRLVPVFPNEHLSGP